MASLSDSQLLPGSDMPPTAVYVKLTPDVVRALIESKGQNVKLCTGSKLHLKIGQTVFSASSVAEASHVDLYGRPDPGSAFRNIGKLSHRLSIQREFVSTANLKSQTSSLQREKEANKATLLQEVPVKAGKRGSSKPPAPPLKSASTPPVVKASTPPVSINLAASLNSSPPAGSPRSIPGSPGLPKPRTLAITSNKPLSSLSIVSAPMRVLHLLALGPNTVAAMAQRTNMGVDEVEAIVQQHGRLKDGENGQDRLEKLYVLSDHRYRDLRVWDWKHYTPSQRQQVIDDSVKAFDRLGYPADSVARRNLIDPKIRKLKDQREQELKEKELKELKEKAKEKDGQNDSLFVSSTSSLHSPNTDSVYSTTSAKRLPSSAASTPRATTPNTISSPQVTQSSPKVVNGLSSPLGATDSSSPARKVGGLLKIKSPSPKKNFASKDTEDPVYSGVPALLNGKETPNGKKTSKASAPSTDKLRAKRKSDIMASGRSAKKAAIDEDLFELARRFRDTYSEYAKLYALLSKEPKRPNGDVQRLLTMHKELESWKQRLWASQR